MVRVERRGRRNHYAVDPEARLRHPTLAHVPLGRIIAAVGSGWAPRAPRRHDRPASVGNNPCSPASETALF
jgi:hypothetical protein